MVSRTAWRALALSAAGTESSRSRIIASVPAAMAFSAQGGLCPGTKSIDRYGFTRCLPMTWRLRRGVCQANINGRQCLMSEQVVICEPVRTPIGRYGGALKALTAAELGEIALRGLLDRTGLDPAAVD